MRYAHRFCSSVHTNISSIEKLYTSSDPQEINHLQDELQALQKSPQGAELAQLLLQQQNNYSQFFGALTYTVVINNLCQESGPSPQFLYESIVKSMLHFSSSCQDLHSNILTVKKLISNLSLLFFSYPELFPTPLTQLQSLLAQSSVSSVPYTDNIPTCHIELLLNFSTILVEDLCKKEVSPMVHEYVFNDAFPVTSSLIKLLIHQNTLFSQIDELCLNCMNSWVTYICYAEDNSTIRYKGEASTFINYIFCHLEISSINESHVPIINLTIRVITEILEVNPTMLEQQSRDYLNSMIFDRDLFGSKYLNFLISEKDELSDEIIAFVNLLITILRDQLIHFAKTLHTERNRYILSILSSLTDFPGIAIEEELISDQLISFWEDLANVFIDDEETIKLQYRNDQQGLLQLQQVKNDIFTKISSIYWNKIHIPLDRQVFKNIKQEFSQYRSSVAEFFLVVYSLLKQPFYESLCKSVVSNLELIKLGDISKMIDLESTLYLIYKITDDVTYLESQSEIFIPYINPIFAADFAETVQKIPKDDELYQVVLSTVIHFYSSIQFYFQKNGEFLNGVFDFLFGILLSSSYNLSLHSSRTILKICQECRDNLVVFLPTLEQLLVEMLRNPKTDQLIRQRMFNAYTSIAQSIRDPTKFGQILFNLLSAIETRVQEISRDEVQFDNNEEKIEYFESLISCVGEIGKATQVPDEINEFYTQDQLTETQEYWNLDPLHVRELISSIVYYFSINNKQPQLMENSLVTEKCCNIWKCGLGEEINGPFVFPLETILKYIVEKIIDCNAHSATLLYGLLESLVICRFKDLNEVIMEEVICNIFFNKLEFINSDTDLIQCSITLYATIMEKKPSLILYSPIFEQTILSFALDSLNAKEQFVLKASSKFWMSFLALKKGTSRDQETVKNIMINSGLGSLFVLNLLNSFLSSPRSHLDYFYQVFRNLIAKYSQYAKAWFSSGFSKIEKDIKIDSKGIEMFINKLIVCRGQRTTNEVVKKLWLEANGLIDYNRKQY